MRSLRSRLILSHLLPLLVVIPLLALAFFYAWTSLSALTAARAVLAPSVESLKAQAELLAHLAGRQTDIWSDPLAAQVLLQELKGDTLAITLLDSAGQLVATAPLTDTLDATGLAQGAEVNAVLAGEQAAQVVVTNARQSQFVHIVAPILGADRQLLGVLLVSHEVATAQSVIVQVMLLLGARHGSWHCSCRSRAHL